MLEEVDEAVEYEFSRRFWSHSSNPNFSYQHKNLFYTHNGWGRDGRDILFCAHCEASYDLPMNSNYFWRVLRNHQDCGFQHG